MGEGLGPDNLLRDVFNRRTVTGLADRLRAASSAFDRDRFLAEVLPRLDALSFRGRVELVRDALARCLPSSFPDAVDALVRALGPELDGKPAKLEDFIIVPQCAFVSQHGRGHFDLSMRALYEMTKRFSAEGDLRTFLEVDYDRAMRILSEWTGDPNPDVRRLVSEGTRPRLPMAPRIRRFEQDPRPVLALLERLKDDPSEYVRRSVANNLNDIAKDHPDLVVATLERWGADPKLARHALRTLVKRGDPGALRLLGFGATAAVRSRLEVAPRRVRAGGTLRLAATLASTSKAPQRIVLDFAVHFVKANGTRAPKVFKWTTLQLAPGANVALEKTRRIQDTAGRTIRPGRHAVELRINGAKGAEAEFTVLPREGDGSTARRSSGGRRQPS